MIPKVVYGAMVAFSLGTLAFSAPAGGWLVAAPPAEKAHRDPSVRAGSAHGHSRWVWVGGGYHGGK